MLLQGMVLLVLLSAPMLAQSQQGLLEQQRQGLPVLAQ
jgi:hypothetical protein